MRRSWMWGIGAVLVTACAGSGRSNAGDTDDTDPASSAERRGERYCEVLAAFLADASVHLDVYSTEGLSDCPDAAWTALDVPALKAQFGSDVVVLNGPRYWTLDSLAGSTLQDATVVPVGDLDMRKAGAIDLPGTDLLGLSAPYTRRTIRRNSAFHFRAGGRVYELTDADGHTYNMQSYSVQKEALTEAALLGLDATLDLPDGWSFATRVLAEELVLTATEGEATVVQDDLGNTYSLAR